MAGKNPRKANGGFELSQAPSHLLRRCVQYANDLFSRESSATDLTKQQFTVLAAVEQNEGMSQTDLVAITGIDRSTLAEMIRRMIDKGLLDRERTESDQRANAVRIAMAGRKALRSARSASERVERTLLSSLTAGGGWDSTSRRLPGRGTGGAAPGLVVLLGSEACTDLEGSTGWKAGAVLTALCGAWGWTCPASRIREASMRISAMMPQHGFQSL